MNDGEAFCSRGRFDMRSTVKSVFPPNSYCSTSRKPTDSAFRSHVAVPRNNLRASRARIFLTLCVSFPVTTRTFWCMVPLLVLSSEKAAGYSMQSKLTKSIGLRDGG
jgi:hypothetical protein